MFPTIPVTDITNKWFAAIAGSAAISAFCMSTYGKPLSLFYGINGKNPPEAQFCPLVIVFPGDKDEGIGEINSYTISVGWSILQPAVTVNGSTYVNSGVDEADTLGQLILTTVAEINPSFPIRRVRYGFESNDFFPQFPGRFDATIEIPLVMGAELTY